MTNLALSLTDLFISRLSLPTTRKTTLLVGLHRFANFVPAEGRPSPRPTSIISDTLHQLVRSTSAGLECSAGSCPANRLAAALSCTVAPLENITVGSGVQLQLQTRCCCESPEGKVTGGTVAAVILVFKVPHDPECSRRG